MPRKPKFRPEVTRIKLNPEQAVLSCNCYNVGRSHPALELMSTQRVEGTFCIGGLKAYQTIKACGSMDSGTGS